MRNYSNLWQLVLVLLMASTCVKAKPLVSFGVSYQQPQPYVGPGPYYNSYYGGPAGPAGPYQIGGGYYSSSNSNHYYSSPGGPYPYRYPYAAGHRYGALDVGIGALSLTPFLL
ncbi:uncharacterized protein LOC111078689 isoform X2 [Drosophila obscura]|uniref:uncharacterized protein LOC111078689 isoform X2 n=1 Tax=Drosophila obscura TaxID=7282 RepID=UPI001BB1A5E5|nr:uncharacterized protein LOC111078689 isoform X2 [Drosophila obscura]